MRKRLLLLKLTCLLIFLFPIIANSYYWPPSNVPPGPPPNYTQIDTTYFLGTPSLPLPPPDSGGVYIWYDQGIWQVANHIYSKGNSLEQFHCCILVQMEQPPTPGVNVFAEQFELISTKYTCKPEEGETCDNCYRQNDRWGWIPWGGNLYEIWWDVNTREWKSGSGDPNDFMKFIIAGTAVDFNIWSSGHNGNFGAHEIYLGFNKTALSTVPGYYDYFSGINDPYQSQAGSDPANDPNVTIFTQKSDTLRSYNKNGLINPSDSFSCDPFSYGGKNFGNYGPRYSGTFAYEGNGIEFSTYPMIIPNYHPNIDLPDDTTLLICPGDSVCISIFASDPDPDDTITVEKVSGAGSYTPVTALTPIHDTLCFIPDSNGVYEFIFKVTDQHGATDYDTTYYTITINSPPTVSGPADKNVFVCSLPSTICVKPFTFSDPNNNIQFKTTNKGTLSGDSVCYNATTAGPDTIIVTVTDSCGAFDKDTVIVTKTINSPPNVTGPADKNVFLCSCNEAKVIILKPFSFTDPNNNIQSKTTNKGTLSGDSVYYTNTSCNPDTIIVTVTDSCGAFDKDTVIVTKTLNSPPMVTGPADKAVALCSLPATICVKPFTFSDPDNNIQSKTTNKGTLSGDSVCYTATTSDPDTIIVTVTDSCGATDKDTVIVIKTLNSPPVVTAEDGSKFFCGPDTLRFIVTATDPDPIDTLTLSGPGIPTPIKGVSPLTDTIAIFISAADTYNYIYTVSDSCGATDYDTATWVITMNNPPTVTLPADFDTFMCTLGDICIQPIIASDPDVGDIFIVTKVEGPGIFTPDTAISPAQIIDTLCFTPANKDSTYRFIFKVTNSCGTFDYDTMFVTVDMNQAPTVNLPADKDTFMCSAGTICVKPITATDPDTGDTLTLEKIEGPGTYPPRTGVSPLTDSLCFSADKDTTYRIIFRVKDKCDATDYDTMFVTVRLNDPPTVALPLDKDTFMCLAGTICVKPITATDPDTGDTLTLEKIEGPGTYLPRTGVSPLTDSLCFTADKDTTYRIIFKVKDKCNATDYDTMFLVVNMNSPPTVTAQDGSKFFCEPDTLKFPVTATDPDPNDTITLSGPGIPTRKGVSPLSDTAKIPVSLSNTYTFVYQVSNHCGVTDYDTATWVVKINSPPTLEVPQGTIITCLGDTATFPVRGIDPDTTYNITLEKISGPGDFPPLTGRPPLQGNWSWFPQPSDTSFNPHKIVFKVTDNCGRFVIDTVWVIVQSCACDIFVKIGEADCANPGDTISIPVLLKTSHALGGFDLRVEFDPTVLYFQGANRGNDLPSGWEYFTYRQLPCPNCGCCKYKLLLLGVYDIKDLHAGEAIEPSSDYIEIARLKFRVANDNNLRGFFINVCFEWDEGNCTQNAFSDPSGYILYVSSNPEEFSYAECDTQFHPGNEVLNIVCFERCGGIQICTTGEKVVGDINLNLIPYDPADLTLFSSYFIYGRDVFVDDPYWRSVQIANTDVNRDGFTLTLSDFIYMIRVMIHDAPPLPKLVSEESQLNVLLTSRESEHIITFNSRNKIAAVLLVFKPKDEVISSELIYPEMQMRYGIKNDEFRVLIYSPVGNSISSGNNQILRIKAEKGIELSSVEAVDPYGRPLTVSISAKALPKTLSLYPNYPNPFNPETNISFALPVDSRVSLKIYNLTGQLVKTLLEENMSAGTYTVRWDGTNISGERVASGIYFYKLTAGNYSQTRKMCMIK